MFGRWWALLMLLLAFGAPALAQSRILAVGDLHGDYTAWRQVAGAAGLMDARGRWTGGKTVLVQMGDVPDRGPDSLKIVRDLIRLQREAQRAGGRVIVLVGNHEAMNVTGDLRYVSAGEYAAFVDRDSARRRTMVFAANRASIAESYRHADAALSDSDVEAKWMAATPLGYVEHRLAWQPTGEIGRWVIANPAVLLLDGTLFVHAGISPAYAVRSIADINQAVAAALKAGETAETSILHDPVGPLWYRGFALKDDGGAVAGSPVEAELDNVLNAYGAKRLVIAHTPQLAGIRLLHDGRLAQTDTGISAAYGGTPSYLEIMDGKMVAHMVARAGSKGGG